MTQPNDPIENKGNGMPSVLAQPDFASDPRVMELVKLFARTAAESDFRRALKLGEILEPTNERSSP